MHFRQLLQSYQLFNIAKESNLLLQDYYKMMVFRID